MRSGVLTAVREFGAGASRDEIAWAESRLAVQFPPCYVSFLREFGWMAAGPLELYGLGADVPEYLDLVCAIEAERGPWGHALPHHLLPVMSDGAGGHYCLDTTRPRGHCPVVYWDSAAGPCRQPEHISDDFAEWFVAEMERHQPLRGR